MHKKLTEKSFAQSEAKTIWTKIQNYKWLLSEKKTDAILEYSLPRLITLKIPKNFPTTP